MEVGVGAVLLLGYYTRIATLLLVYPIMIVATYVHLVVDDPSLFPLQPEEPGPRGDGGGEGAFHRSVDRAALNRWWHNPISSLVHHVPTRGSLLYVAAGLRTRSSRCPAHSPQHGDATTTFAVPTTLSVFAAMTTAPFAWAVTCPASLTEAMASSDDDQADVLL